MKCRRCKKPGKLVARGLDNSCYLIVQRAGELAKYPAKKRRTWDFTEDYEFIKKTYGGTQEQIAARMGMTRNDLNQRLIARRKWGQL